MDLQIIQARIEQLATHRMGSIVGDDAALEHQQRRAARGHTIRSAAVLILLLDNGDELEIVLTQRSAHLNDHPGQISFPGGRMERRDENLVATALREAKEEIGAESKQIRILGLLPNYLTVTAYEITPVVAASPLQTFRANPLEVENVFTVPLSYVLAERNWRRDMFMRNGQRHEYWAIPYRERYIWGATAGMLRTLRTALLASNL